MTQIRTLDFVKGELEEVNSLHIDAPAATPEVMMLDERSPDGRRIHFMIVNKQAFIDAVNKFK
jgi:hypothetical protein